MILPQDIGCCLEDVFVRPNNPADTKGKTISLKEPGYTLLGWRPNRIQPPTPAGRNIHFPHDKSIGTDFNEVIRVMPHQNISQDTFLDNEVGDTIRHIKENFGSEPLLKAYQGALDTLRESDRRWKEYMEEEARLQSIFEGEA